MSSNSNTHLTLSERQIIEVGIVNGSTHTAIASTLGKDKSTIGREIKSRRFIKSKCALPVECAIYSKCKPGSECIGDSCRNYVPFTCKRRDRSPGACNGCQKYRSCHFNKYWYDAKKSQNGYEYTLADSRAGVNLTSEEARVMAEILKPLLDKGQSPYQILRSHPELDVTERTLYNYIESGVFEHFGIGPLDLRRQVSRRLPRKKQNEYKKRNDYKYLQGRTYKDYLAYLSENPVASVVQMDTVYNDGSNGPFIQTFKFLRFGFLFAVFHEKKEGQDMVSGLDTLYETIGALPFQREANVILTDRGSEFTLADAFERTSSGELRTRVFYCDPMASGQKGSLENMHIELRYILPKGTDLRELGLTSQAKLNLALSHINSAPKEYFNGRSPMEMLRFIAPDIFESFMRFGLLEIEKDAVLLKPHLLK